MVVESSVEAYVRAAVKHALVEKLDDGTIAASVPGAFGVIAFGVNKRECAAELQRRLEDWVYTWSAAGHTLPVIDGIDLNTEDIKALLSYCEHPDPETDVLLFDNDDEFEAAMANPASSQP